MRRSGTWALCLCFLTLLSGCAAKRTRVTAEASAPHADPTTYIDLEPGWRLRVVTPILKSGSFQVTSLRQETTGNTISLSAGDDFLGYETAYYAVKAGPEGGIQIIFRSAEITKENATEYQARPLVRLFDLPGWARFVRLIYLTRASEADHDMAIVAASEKEFLEPATRRVQADPIAGCETERRTRCSWVPAGISVRPEKPNDNIQ